MDISNIEQQAQFLLDINEAKDEFHSAIVAKLNSDRNWEIWKVNETSVNSEYTMPEVASDSAWTKVLSWIAINYNWDTYTATGLPIYIPARLVSPDSLEHEWNYYVENQSSSDPIFMIADQSYFIAPAFRESGLVDRIKLTWVRKIADYTISTSEADIKIPVDFQRLLIWACIPSALMAKRADDNQIQKAQNDYESKKITAIQNLSQRKEWPITMEYPISQNDDIIINCLPLSFDYGLYQILMSFKFGGTVVLERSFLYPYQDPLD